MSASLPQLHLTLKILCGLGCILVPINLYFFFYPSDLELAFATWLQFGHPAWLTPMMQFISNSVLLLGAVSLAVCMWELWKQHRPASLMLALALLSLLAIEPAKHLVERPRPTVDDLATSWTFYGYSFPSGHSFTATVLVGTLAFLAVQHRPTTRMRYLVASLGSTYVLLMGWSRVYLGAHYPSDVLGGYTLGVAVLLALVLLYHRASLRWPIAPAGSN